jgi:hypothetical protein
MAHSSEKDKGCDTMWYKVQGARLMATKAWFLPCSICFVSYAVFYLFLVKIMTEE